MPTTNATISSLLNPSVITGTPGILPGLNANVLSLTNNVAVNTTDLFVTSQTVTLTTGLGFTDGVYQDISILSGAGTGVVTDYSADASEFDTVVINLGPGDLDNTRGRARIVGDTMIVDGDFSATRISTIVVNGVNNSVNASEHFDFTLLSGDYTALTTGLQVIANAGSGDDNFLVALETASGIAGVNQVFDGGAGFDTLDFTPAMYDLYINLAGPVDAQGYTTITSTDLGATNTLRVKGVEAVDGGSGNDTFIGGAGQQAFFGNDGNDQFYGGAGNDEMNGGAGDDIFYGDAGLDTYVGGDGIDTVDYRTSIGAVTIDLQATLRGRPAPQVGGDASGDAISGVENIIGTNVAAIGDRISGDAADNFLSGLAGNDTLNGRGGNDVLDGGTGNDTMAGGIGDDTYFVDVVGDRVSESGNQGTDTVVSSTISLTLASYANVENLRLEGLLALNLTGSTGNNLLEGNAANNIIAAGAGADILVGGAGADTLDGGVGNDIFRYLDTLDTGIGAGARDVIRSFVIGQDKIDLSAIDANADFFSPGDDAFLFMGTGAFSASGGDGEVRFQQFGTGATAITLIQGDSNADGIADFEIQVTGLVNFGATDFFL